jgi:hypothetical protein
MRNVAPYIGVNWDRKVVQTATIARINSESVRTFPSSLAKVCSGNERRGRWARPLLRMVGNFQ